MLAGFTFLCFLSIKIASIRIPEGAVEFKKDWPDFLYLPKCEAMRKLSSAFPNTQFQVFNETDKKKDDLEKYFDRIRLVINNIGNVVEVPSYNGYIRIKPQPIIKNP